MRGIVKFCAQECARQKSGAESVYWMFRAWEEAVADRAMKNGVLEVATILLLAGLVDPRNKKGVRRQPVVFANGTQGIDHEEVLPAMERLCKYGQPCDDPGAFYWALMKIHPFVDGNGRVGSLIYNWDTLDLPGKPPDYFGGE